MLCNFVDSERVPDVHVLAIQDLLSNEISQRKRDIADSQRDQRYTLGFEFGGDEKRGNKKESRIKSRRREF